MANVAVAISKGGHRRGTPNPAQVLGVGGRVGGTLTGGDSCTASQTEITQKGRKGGKGSGSEMGSLDEKVTCTNRRKCCLFSGVTWLGHKGFVRGWQEIWLEKQAGPKP